MAIEKVKVPDIGGATDVDVIEILVKPGDSINKEDSIITLESDKASMEVPSPLTGKIKELNVKEGDKVSEGDLILSIETEAEEQSEKAEAKTKDEAKDQDKVKEKAKQTQTKEETESKSKTKEAKKSGSEQVEVKVPDIGGATDVDVIEVMVKSGDTISKEQSIITLESEKASMEIPSPHAGTVKDIKVSVGDKVSEGNLILTMMAEGDTGAAKATESEEPAEAKQETTAEDKAEAKKEAAKAEQTKTQATKTEGKKIASKEEVERGVVKAHAGPGVRRYARELGVDLSKVKGSGHKDRVLFEDVQKYVKSIIQQAGVASGAGISVAAAPDIDFSRFGEVETQPLNKIKRLTAQNVHRSWVTVPHVTQFDEADITELEAFRQAHKKEAEKKGCKLTILAFLMRAVVACLKQFPTFNASLDRSGENLILKKYFHIGVAIDTPNGLVVAVIRDVDKKGFFQLARELADISEKAREKGLSMNDMQGSCFTISSLGGIGGTAFTPIVNNPDVAILGVSRSSMKPMYIDGSFEPRLMLPLSLSYDHRVIDGAQAARFTTYLAGVLNDMRRILL